MWIRIVVLCLLLTGCGLLSGKPSLEVVGDEASVQQTAAGSTASAEEIGEVVTINEDGLDPWMWLLIGMLLPMPRFMKIIF